MEELFKDLRILHYSAVAFKVLYLLKAVLTVGIIVFSAMEAFRLFKNRQALMQ